MRLAFILGGAVVAVVGFRAVAGMMAPPPPALADAPVMIRGEDAFKAGDRAALQAAIAELKAVVPSSVKDPSLLGCSAEAYSLRRKVRFMRSLEYLDNSTVFANGEAGRFYFARTNLNYGGAGRVNDDWPTDFDCEKDPNHRTVFALEEREIQAPRTAAQERKRAWELALREQLGEKEFKRRMDAIAKRLYARRLVPYDRWDG
jgi:hypothetical protein